MVEDLELDRFDTIGRGALIGLGPVLELQEDVQQPLPIYTRVLGPHLSERLANVADRVLHRAGDNVLTTGAYVTTVVLGGRCGKDQGGVIVQQW